MYLTILITNGDVLRLYRDLSNVGDRVAGGDAEVRHDLIPGIAIGINIPAHSRRK